MEINCYNFFFHPIHEDHSSETKVLSVITALALSVLTGGLWLLVMGAVCLSKRSCTQEKGRKFVGIEALKAKQKERLAKLETLAADPSQQGWQHLQTHTSHPDSGFDWWMFPTDRASSGQGDKYRVSKENIEALKADPDFMASYRRGVILVAQSWGWDLEQREDIETDQQKWTGYQVRLGKMLHSLILFGQDDLHQQLVKCIDAEGIYPSLQPWIKALVGK